MNDDLPGLTTLLKSIHIVTLGVWVGGLLLFPALLAQRRGQVPGPALHRMHRRARFLYTAVLSPAAIAAIASGTALIFLREVYVPWFGAKLVLVAGLAMIHVFTARGIVDMFQADADPPRRIGIMAFGTTALLATGALVLVLGKPDLALEAAPGREGLFTPGGLGARLGWIAPPLAPETGGQGGVAPAAAGGSSSASRSGEPSTSSSSSASTSPTP